MSAKNEINTKKYENEMVRKTRILKIGSVRELSLFALFRLGFVFRTPQLQ